VARLFFIHPSDSSYLFSHVITPGSAPQSLLKGVPSVFPLVDRIGTSRFALPPGSFFLQLSFSFFGLVFFVIPFVDPSSPFRSRESLTLFSLCFFSLFSPELIQVVPQTSLLCRSGFRSFRVPSPLSLAFLFEGPFKQGPTFLPSRSPFPPLRESVAVLFYNHFAGGKLFLPPPL